MRLLSMSAEDFRCFTRMDVSFDPELTVLVGSNGSGKTAVLDAVAILLEQLSGSADNRPGGEISASDVRTGATSARLSYCVSSGKQTHTLTFSSEGQPVSATDRDILQKNRNRTVRIDRNPVAVYYGAERGISAYHRGIHACAGADDACRKASGPYMDFPSTLSWFIEKSSEEALEAVRTGNPEHRIPELQAVRQAVSTALGEYNEPCVGETPPGLLITRKDAPHIPLTLQQLSDSYRTMLALVMDLARRMIPASDGVPPAEGKTVLHGPGIVLIDEIELHLHPSWQQTVLPRLMDIFPNVQFIVTTNSPPVITSLDAAHIRILGEGGRIHTAPQGTWGAEASRIMKQIFGVDNRPPSQARDELEEYSRLVYDDRWDTDRALELRTILDERYGGQEPGLVELDMHIENRKWEMRENGKVQEDA